MSEMCEKKIRSGCAARFWGEDAKRLFWAWGICALSALASPGEPSLYKAAMLLGGGAFAVNDSTLSFNAILATGVPLFAFILLFSGRLTSDLSRSAVIFTRTDRRVAYVVQWLVVFAGLVFVYEVGRCLVTMATCAPFSWASESFLLAGWLAVQVVVLDGMQTLLLAVVVNLLAIRVNAIAACAMVLALHFGLLLLCGFCGPAIRGLIAFLPATQGTLAWHDAPLGQLLTSEAVVPGFSVAQSCIYLAALLGGASMVAVWAIKRYEVL